MSRPAKSLTLTLHNPNRVWRDSLYDGSRLCVTFYDAAPDWVPPREIPWPHPDNPRITEMYELVDRDRWLYEFRSARKRRKGDPVAL